MKATKRILRYLKHIQNVGLWYPKGVRFELIRYSDSDYTGYKVKREHIGHMSIVGKITCVLVIKEAK